MCYKIKKIYPHSGLLCQTRIFVYSVFHVHIDNFFCGVSLCKQLLTTIALTTIILWCQWSKASHSDHLFFICVSFLHALLLLVPCGSLEYLVYVYLTFTMGVANQIGDADPLEARFWAFLVSIFCGASKAKCHIGITFFNCLSVTLSVDCITCWFHKNRVFLPFWHLTSTFDQTLFQICHLLLHFIQDIHCFLMCVLFTRG